MSPKSDPFASTLFFCNHILIFSSFINLCESILFLLYVILTTDLSQISPSISRKQNWRLIAHSINLRKRNQAL
ncbi:hypothetical protein PIB30_068914 [Stylosanthes scabra]|uniref:Uncharacterized protein n=1 Tax=Stylosanthes scabra TaxID=79078 RepID=A0ABU6YKL3_9FABA|nr:hypothetical protein [Stylosanthes scabra]